MRTLFVAVVIWLMAMGASADITKWIPGVVGPGVLPDHMIAVGEDCNKVPFTPCEEVIQDGIDTLEASQPTADRVVLTFSAAAPYDESLDCTTAATLGTTTLQGLAGTGDSRPHVRGIDAGPATITMRNCTLDNFRIEKSEETANPAIHIPATFDSGVDRAVIRNTWVHPHNDLPFNGVNDNGPGAGEELVLVEHIDGRVTFDHVDFDCRCAAGVSCDGGAGICCDVDSSCIHVDAAFDPVGLHSLDFLNSRIAHGGANTAAGSAMMELDATPVTRVVENRIGCEDTLGVGVNCFEVDSGNVADLLILNNEVSEIRGNDSTLQGRFVDIIGAGAGSAVQIGHIDGSENFQISSRWLDEAPIYKMGCSNPISVFIDAADLNAPPAVTWIAGGANTDLSAAGSTAIFGATSPPVEHFRLPTNALALHDLDVLASVAPGGVAAWSILPARNGVIGNINTGCLVFGAGVGCFLPPFDFTSPAGAGLVLQPADRLTLQLIPSGGPALSDFHISYCLSETPR